MINLIKKTLAYFFVVIGLIGLVTPLFPGIVFLFIAGLISGEDYIAKFLKRKKQRE